MLPTLPQSPEERATSIVFFDGYCGLCDRFVGFLVQHDHKRRLRFAPLQGETAKRLLTPGERESLKTVILVHKGQKLQQSAAALTSLQALGGLWGMAATIALFIPSLPRDMVYEFIATRRYAFFGRRETCRLPSPAERAVFLD